MASSKIDTATSHIQAGSRYVFFTTLSNEQSNSLRALGKHALNRLNNIDNQLMGIDDIQPNGLSRIEIYLQYLQKTAQQMQQNELIFVQQQLQKIKEIKKIFNNDDLEKIEAMLIKINNDQYIDNYNDIIAILNNLLLDPREKENIIKSQYQNIKKLEKNFQNLTMEEQKEAEQAYLYSYELYRKNFAQQLKVSEQDAVEIPYITALMTDKINTAISQLANNPTLVKSIKKQLIDHGIQETDLLETIIGIIVEAVFENDPKKPILDLVQQTAAQSQKTINNKIKQFLQSNSFDAFSQRTQRTLEQLAMRKENEFSDLANTALMIKDEDMIEVFNTYDPDGKYGLKDSYIELQQSINSDNPNQSIISNRKGHFTRKLGQAIQTSLIAQVQAKNPQLTSFSEIQKQIRQDAENYYQKRLLKQELSTQLKVLTIRTSDVAEILASNEVHNVLYNVLLDRVNGKSINLKSDVSFVIGFTPKTGKTALPVKHLNQIINKELEGFLPEYHQLAKGATDTEKSRQVLIKRMQNMIKAIENKLQITDKNRAVIEAKLKDLYDVIFGNISVKDYELYNNNLGFHGGSLGASGTPESVINNIIGMYDAGGISIIDANDVLFAILNATDSTYGDEALKTHVANYLLGGAALAMFDEDFITAQNFLDKTTDILFQTGHIRSVQLYRLNSVYVPASYILYTIYQQLVPIYEDIVTNFENLPKTNKVVISTHNLTVQDIKDFDNTIDSWNDISERAIKNTKIQFLFMAGMLDIFKNLGKAFNISFN